jgi:L-ascorbate metabolism protein UlaG (beta-lactamase superfamily)
MIKPILQDDEFLADVARSIQELDKFHLWWLGQSGYLVNWRGAFLLIDPYLSDSLTKKYAGTAKPHVRLTERVIAPGQLSFVQVVTSSHNHTDHLDGETLKPLMAANPDLTILVPGANRDFAAQRLEVAPERLTAIIYGWPQTISPFTFHVVPAAHEELEVDQEGRHRFIGLVIEAGPFTLYHSGDTVRYPGMAVGLRRWDIDVALLPINGRDPARGVAGNLSGPEAVQLGVDINAGSFPVTTRCSNSIRCRPRDSGLPHERLACGIACYAPGSA